MRRVGSGVLEEPACLGVEGRNGRSWSGEARQRCDASAGDFETGEEVMPFSSVDDDADKCSKERLKSVRSQES